MGTYKKRGKHVMASGWNRARPKGSTTDRIATDDQARSYYELKVVGAAMDQLEHDLGGREALIKALIASPPDPGLDMVVGAIADPRQDCRKLSKVCAQAGISLGQVLEAFKRGAMMTAIVKSIQAIADITPEVVRYVLIRSLPYEDDCPECDGRGDKAVVTSTGIETHICTRCRGEKRLLQKPDFEQQKFVLEKLAGFGQKALVEQTIDLSDHRSVTFDVSGAAHARLLQAADKVLHATRISPPLASTDTPVYTPDVVSEG